MNSNHPSIKKALGHLSDGIAQGIWVDGSRMPPIVSLAQSIHVSTRAMQCALQIMAEKGTITVTKKRGVYVGRDRVFAVAPVTEEKWELVKRRLESAIFAGSIRERVLPSFRVLSEQYGAGYTAIKRSLTALCNEGLLERYKSGYRICQSTPGHSYASLLLVGPGSTLDSHFSALNDRLLQALRYFERECALARINLVRLGCNNQTAADGFLRAVKGVERSNAVIGSVVWAPMLGGEQLRMITRTLSALNRPLGVYFDDRVSMVPDTVYANVSTRLFTIGDFQAGRQMGHYLMARGCRTIAFLSASPLTEWSQRRLEGLRSVCDGAGAAITVFNTGSYIPVDQQSSLCSDVASLINRFPGIKAYTAFKPGEDQVIHNYNNLVSLINSMGAFKSAAVTIERLVAASGSFQAVIGDNDFIALIALDALRKRGGVLPMVVGFDDTAEAVHFDLTSYNFNIQRIAHQMLQFIRNPDHRHFAVRNHHIECEGLVIERGSTRSS